MYLLFILIGMSGVTKKRLNKLFPPMTIMKSPYIQTF